VARATAIAATAPINARRVTSPVSGDVVMTAMLAPHEQTIELLADEYGQYREAGHPHAPDVVLTRWLDAASSRVRYTVAGMTAFSGQVVIERPVAEVFDFVADGRNRCNDHPAHGAGDLHGQWHTTSHRRQQSSANVGECEQCATTIQLRGPRGTERPVGSPGSALRGSRRSSRWRPFAARARRRRRRDQSGVP
jgi:hypothetical protein